MSAAETAPPGPVVRPSSMVDEMRTLVLAMDSDGTILERRGGYGGFLGLDLEAIVGSSVFDFLDPADVDKLATYLVETVGEIEEVIALPMPFRLTVIGGDGIGRPVDIIPSGHRDESGGWRWTAVIVPVALNSSVVRAIDRELDGGERDEVCALLCDELTMDDTAFSGRWFLVDLAHPGGQRVHRVGPADDQVADVIDHVVRFDGWSPWAEMDPGSVRGLDVDELPSAVRDVMGERRWRRCLIAPVHVDGALVAAFVMLSLVPNGYSPIELKSNVADRIEVLVRSTRMLMTRWEESRKLEIAATTDQLTGLPNRHAFFETLARHRDGGTLLYLDLDEFKSVNDRYGHAVGDRVLRTIAAQIVETCREEDTVARLGGDEFVVLVADSDDSIGTRLGNRILRSVGCDLGLELGPERIGVSVGLAELGELDDPLNAADRAMLLAKRRGRGRMVEARRLGEP